MQRLEKMEKDLEQNDIIFKEKTQVTDDFDDGFRNSDST